jgi:hypothetical protein
MAQIREFMTSFVIEGTRTERYDSTYDSNKEVYTLIFAKEGSNAKSGKNRPGRPSDRHAFFRFDHALRAG